MSKSGKPAVTQNKPASPTARGAAPAIALVILALVALSWWCFRSRPSASAPTTGSPGQAPATNAAVSAPTTRPEFQKLLGSWVRPDGGYVLEIRSVDNLGAMDAAYFNPNPIHVSKAAALRDGSTTRVFIELQDENYPGCTYTLVYDPPSDQLTGDYFQAAMQEHFDVVFGRKRQAQ